MIRVLLRSADGSVIHAFVMQPDETVEIPVDAGSIRVENTEPPQSCASPDHEIVDYLRDKLCPEEIE